MKRSRRIEWPNISASARDRHIADGRCSRLGNLFYISATIPHAITNNVRNLDIVDKREFRAFGNVDAVLHKIARTHMHRSARAATSASPAARCTGCSAPSSGTGGSSGARAYTGRQQNTTKRQYGQHHDHGFKSLATHRITSSQRKF